MDRSIDKVSWMYDRLPRNYQFLSKFNFPNSLHGCDRRRRSCRVIDGNKCVLFVESIWHVSSNGPPTSATIVQLSSSTNKALIRCIVQESVINSKPEVPITKTLWLCSYGHLCQVISDSRKKQRVSSLLGFSFLVVVFVDVQISYVCTTVKFAADSLDLVLWSAISRFEPVYSPYTARLQVCYTVFGSPT